jgi:hypothetical protein
MRESNSGRGQLDTQLQQTTTVLQQLESLLMSERAGEVILTEFRDAVNRIRIAGWMLEKMKANEAGATPFELLAQERIRCITRMSQQLAAFLVETDSTRLEGFETLRDSVEELMAAVRVHLAKSQAEI